MGKLVILVGISGSGKDHIARSFPRTTYEKFDTHSSDDIRKELYGDASIQKNHHEVFNLLNKRTKESLSHGRNVFYNATNLNRKRRIHLINEMKTKFPELIVHCLLVLAPFELCISRDLKRERTVGEKVILKQAMSFHPPYWDEGWDDIHIVHNYLLEEGPAWIEDCLYRLDAIPHDNPHHCGMIGAHLKAVDENLLSFNNMGMLHDIGKYYTKVFKGDVAHYYGHENVSAYMSYFADVDLSTKECFIRAYVISLHMRYYSYDSKEKKSAFINSLPVEVRESLVLLMWADQCSKKKERKLNDDIKRVFTGS